MQSRVRRGLLVAASVCFVSVLAVGARAVSSALTKPPVPPVIAVVDLKNAIDGLDERKAKEAQFRTRGKELQDGLDKMKTDIEGLQRELEQVPTTNIAKRMELRDKIIRAAAQAKVEKEFDQQLLEEMYCDMLRDLHSKITQACKDLAQKNGYSMVISNDESAEIPRLGQDDVKRAISLKRMIYVDKTHDITQEIINKMNNDFAAAGGKVPPAPAPSPSPAPPTKAEH